MHGRSLMRDSNYTRAPRVSKNCSRRKDHGFIRLDNGARDGEDHNAMAMFKAAYFSFIAALVATPVHLVAGNMQTRSVVLGLLLLSAAFVAIGFQRRP